MKKVYTVIAALMLISAMASCSGVESGKASSQITGTWKYTIDITDDFDQMSMDLIGSPTDATVEMVYAITFNEDGTYSLYIDRDAVKASIQAYLEKMENTFLCRNGSGSRENIPVQQPEPGGDGEVQAGLSRRPEQHR